MTPKTIFLAGMIFAWLLDAAAAHFLPYTLVLRWNGWRLDWRIERKDP